MTIIPAICSSLFEVCATQPLDVIKTHYQTNTKLYIHFVIYILDLYQELLEIFHLEQHFYIPKIFSKIIIQQKIYQIYKKI